MTWSSGEGAGLAEQVRRQRFSMAMRGYAVAEVDRFLDELAEGVERLHRVAVHQAGDQPVPADLPTAERIQQQTFTVVVNGYAMIEVDAFLDDITEAVNRAWSRLPAPPPARPAFPQGPPPGPAQGFPQQPPPGFPQGPPQQFPPPQFPQQAPQGMQPVLASGAPLELPAPAVGGELTGAAVRAVEFPRSFRGYARKQVDEFLAHAAETLDRLDAALERPPPFGRPARPPGMAAADVQRAGFYAALRGYAMPQVDDFLDRLAEALAARDELFDPDPGHPRQVPPPDRR